jgi:hypothetical protein
MVKGMVDAHNGSIIVESDPDNGMKFIINLTKDARSKIEGQVPHKEEQPNRVEQAPQVPKRDNSELRP